MSRFFDELEDRLRASASELHGEGAPPRRRRRRRPPRRLLLVAILAGIGGAAVPAISAMTDIWRPEGVRGRDVPMATRTAPADSVISCGGVRTPPLDVGPPVGEEYTSVLGVLARSRTAADRLDPKYLRGPWIGVDVAGIRRVGVTADGDPYYVIPTRGIGRPPWPRRCLRGLTERQRRMVTARPRRLEPTICTMSDGGGCSALSGIASHGVYGTSGTVRGRATVNGLAPNGVRAVRMTYGRSTRTFPVRDNFFTFALDGIDVERALPPDRVEWLMDDGSLRDVTP